MPPTLRRAANAPTAIRKCCIVNVLPGNTARKSIRALAAQYGTSTYARKSSQGWLFHVASLIDQLVMGYVTE
jgi:hypothetical protein